MIEQVMWERLMTWQLRSGPHLLLIERFKQKRGWGEPLIGHVTIILVEEGNGGDHLLGITNSVRIFLVIAIMYLSLLLYSAFSLCDNSRLNKSGRSENGGSWILRSLTWSFPLLEKVHSFVYFPFLREFDTSTSINNEPLYFRSHLQERKTWNRWLEEPLLLTSYKNKMIFLCLIFWWLNSFNWMYN